MTAISKLHKLTKAQLVDEAKQAGLSTAGTKKELIDRITEAWENQDQSAGGSSLPQFKVKGDLQPAEDYFKEAPGKNEPVDVTPDPDNPDDLANIDVVDAIVEGDEVLGDANLPPMEMSQEDFDALIQKEEKNRTHLEQVRNASKHYGNGENEWKLIQKTYNNELGYQHMTMAMKLGTRGILVCVIQGLDHHHVMSTEFIPNGQLVQIDVNGEKHWKIK